MSGDEDPAHKTKKKGGGGGAVINPFSPTEAAADANNKKTKKKQGQVAVYTVGLVQVGDSDSELKGLLAVGTHVREPVA